jgi:Zn-dependent protease with chaperone function
MPAESHSTPWLGQVARRWGHYGATWLVLSVGGILALGLNPPRVSGTSALIAPIAIFGFALASWSAMRQHDRRLCELCTTSMPLNMTERAARYRLRFTVVHAVVSKPLVISYLVVLIGSDLVLMRGTAVERLAWAGIQSSMVYLVLAYASHRRFQPWCPQCRGGHGERDRSDDRGPAPLDNHSR